MPSELHSRGRKRFNTADKGKNFPDLESRGEEKAKAKCPPSPAPRMCGGKVAVPWKARE